MKNAFIKEAKTVTAGTKFIETAQQVEEHTENWFVKREARQRRTPREKGCGRPS